MKIVIFTGYSGAGKSTALRYIEESGYYCVDNLPAQLLKNFIMIALKSDMEKVAVVIDSRGHDFMKDLESLLKDLERRHRLRIVFIESHLDTITKRFKEHRLRHPMALRGTIKQGFEIEKKLLTSLRQRAGLVLNTSDLSVNSLKAQIRTHILDGKGGSFEVHLMSFGFKYGVPHEVDIVIDVRLLANPFFKPILRKKTGKSLQVKKFMMRQTDTGPFLDKTASYLGYLLKKYTDKGRPFVTIGFGCTGGKHRSVFVAEKLKMILQERYKKVKVSHRDIALV
jgi:UPF0042 nucleotide-binding protein